VVENDTDTPGTGFPLISSTVKTTGCEEVAAKVTDELGLALIDAGWPAIMVIERVLGVRVPVLTVTVALPVVLPATALTDTTPS
jgi:hypothetical protein